MEMPTLKDSFELDSIGYFQLKISNDIGFDRKLILLAESAGA